MEKLNQFLNRYVVLAMYSMLVLALFANIRSCSTNKEVSKLRKNVDSLTTVVNTTVNKQDFARTIENLRIDAKIEGLKTSRRTLYDWNAVVRQVTRPDDQVNKYNEEIEKLDRTRK